MTSIARELGYYSKRYTAEERLFVAIIRSAVLDNDYDYLESRVFEKHCAFLGANPQEIRSSIMSRIPGGEESHSKKPMYWDESDHIKFKKDVQKGLTYRQLAAKYHISASKVRQMIHPDYKTRTRKKEE